MREEDLLLQKRLTELSDRSFEKGIYTHSDFLNPAQQSFALELLRHGEIRDMCLYGLFEPAERQVAVFGSEESFGYEASPEIDCIAISPLSEKFGEELGHRDILGAILSLGVKREKVGDILLDGKRAYAAVLNSITPFLLENLRRIRHTDVRVRLADKPPALLQKEPEPALFFISSERLDCVIAAVFHLSRTAAKELFLQEKVFVNSRLQTNPAVVLHPADMVSIRGMGRFRYEGIEKQTKKGRLAITAAVY